MSNYLLIGVLVLLIPGCTMSIQSRENPFSKEIQLTFDPRGHLLHNTECFSPDSKWIVYDNRSDETKIGSNPTIEKVNIETGEIVQMYKTKNQTEYGPGTGAATYCPTKNRILFIHGIFNCDKSRPYGFRRRTGVAVDDANPGKPIFLDARDVTPPFTAGALRGGTHAHTWSGDGKWISFTYQDAVLGALEKKTGEKNLDLRTVGVMGPFGPVKVDHDPEGENNDGEMFSVLVARVVTHARPGSDDIEKAFSDSWVGVNGYIKSDGSRQKRAIAFQGHVRDKSGNLYSELFIVDLPRDITKPGPYGPLEGTANMRPMPPLGTTQRRLTFLTVNRKYPGIQGPRHWPRSSPDGSRIAFLAKDDAGIVQLFYVSPLGGDPVQLTRNRFSVQTPFNWSPDGKYIAYGMDNSVFITEVATGKSTRLTPRSNDKQKPQFGVTWSYDGKKLAFNKEVPDANGKSYLQVFIITLPDIPVTFDDPVIASKERKASIFLSGSTLNSFRHLIL